MNEWRAGADPLVNHIDGEVNWEIDGISSLTLLDFTIKYCKVLGMKIMFDMHGYARSRNESIWTGSNSVNDFHNAWRWLAARYAENPNLLIMVEGIECTPMEGYTYASTDKFTYNYNWWGGNLRGAADYPVNLGSYQEQLVYSPHAYGPGAGAHGVG